MYLSNVEYPNYKYEELSRQNSNKELIDLFKTAPQQAVEKLFQLYYSDLCKSVYRILKDEGLAEDIVQEVFYELWRKRDRLGVQTSFRAYLKRAAINKSLNYIRDNKIKFDGDEHYAYIESKENLSKQIELKNLKEIVDQEIDKLPPKCRRAFILSRYDDLSYKEIAAEMEISTKTVEKHISKALKILNHVLRPYLQMIIIISMMASNMTFP